MNPNVEIESTYMASYLNLISHAMKSMRIPQAIDQLVPYDPQCKVSPGEMVQMIVMDMLTGRRAMVHLHKWAARIDLDTLQVGKSYCLKKTKKHDSAYIIRLSHAFTKTFVPFSIPGKSSPQLLAISAIRSFASPRNNPP